MLAEWMLFGVGFPLLLTSFYYYLAKAIKDKERGEALLQRLGVELPPPGVIEPDSEAPRDGVNHIAIPGTWIYQPFNLGSVRTLFVLSPLISGPIAFALTLATKKWVDAFPVLKVFALGFLTILTPAILVPSLEDPKVIRAYWRDFKRLRLQVWQRIQHFSGGEEDVEEVDLKPIIKDGRELLSDLLQMAKEDWKLTSEDLSTIFRNLRRKTN